MLRPYQIEINMTIAGAAVGAVLGLPQGLSYGLWGLVIGALIPVPGLFLFSLLASCVLQFFFGESKEDKDDGPREGAAEGKDSKEEAKSDL
ncbi:MAG: hypothetical protein P1V97_04295 [Planctomycetota bacterium]|nr:hypothetical protein [Planctomycetota bacterium]